MPHESAGRLLASARQRLQDQGVESAHLDARLLLQHAAGLSHEDLILKPDAEITGAATERFEQYLARRLMHEPVSRILGEREFYGRVFKLGPATLDPRPATETLIETALSILKPRSRILDLGAGTGAIIVTLLAESPACTGAAVDISTQALEIARENARYHGVADRVEFRQSDWFEAVDGDFDLIVSNPPYIASTDIETLQADVRNFDPRAALDGGIDGLNAYRRIASGTNRFLRHSGSVLVEIGAGQHRDVSAIFAAAGLKEMAARDDLEGHTRCLHFAASC